MRGYHVYKEVWCAAVGEELSCIRSELSQSVRCSSVVKMCLDFYFADLIFVVC